MNGLNQLNRRLAILRRFAHKEVVFLQAEWKIWRIWRMMLRLQIRLILRATSFNWQKKIDLLQIEWKFLLIRTTILRLEIRLLLLGWQEGQVESAAVFARLVGRAFLLVFTRRNVLRPLQTPGWRKVLLIQLVKPLLIFIIYLCFISREVEKLTRSTPKPVHLLCRAALYRSRHFLRLRVKMLTQFSIY